MGEIWLSYPELIDLIGEDVARRLCAVHGGVPIYVPRRAAPGGKLERIVGLRALAELAAKYGGAYIAVPNGRKAERYKARVIALIDKGRPLRDIALELGLTERYVRRLAALSGKRVRQCSLWD